jgi:hypothetical protein
MDIKIRIEAQGLLNNSAWKDRKYYEYLRCFSIFVGFEKPQSTKIKLWIHSL